MALVKMEQAESLRNWDKRASVPDRCSVYYVKETRQEFRSVANTDKIQIQFFCGDFKVLFIFLV